MSYVGNVPTTAAFPFDQFSGNGSTTAFTLSYAPAGTTSIIVSISGVVQNPNTYSVSGTTLTFTPAPPTGSNNIAVLYLGLPVVATLSPGNTAYFTRSVFTATASQTVFTPSGTYQVGFINVIRNGATLAPADYTATNGTTVTLLNACAAGDTVVIEVYNLTSIAGALPVTGGTVTGATTFNSTLSVNGANVSGFTGFKNRIINPGMVIDQRNNGASISVGVGVVYVTDRFFAQIGQGSGHTAQRSTAAPAGFINSLQVTIGTGASPTANSIARIAQAIEGFNTADLGWGAANAQTVTLSFWVRSSVTGTFGGGFYNAAANRTRVFTYAISAANTWEQKTITIPGDTTGTWATDNTAGMYVNWDLGSGSDWQTTADTWTTGADWATSGSVKLAATSGATFYITGVQLERGSNATSYEFRSYGQELALCQRYYYRTSPGALTKILTAGGNCESTVSIYGAAAFPVPMRVSPSALEQTGTASDYLVFHSATATACSAVPAYNAATTNNIYVVNGTVASGLTANRPANLGTNSTSAYLGWSAEL